MSAIYKIFTIFLFFFVYSCSHDKNQKIYTQSKGEEDTKERILIYQEFNHLGIPLPKKYKLRVDKIGKDTTMTFLDDTINVQIISAKNGLFLKTNKKFYQTHSFNLNKRITFTDGIFFSPIINHTTELVEVKEFKIGEKYFKVLKYHEDKFEHSHSLIVSYYLKDFGFLIWSKYYEKYYLKLIDVKGEDTNNIAANILSLTDSIIKSDFFEIDNLPPPKIKK